MGVGGGVLFSQVFDAGIAVTAADFFEVKLQVGGMVGIEDAKQKTTELFARWAGESLASPDCAERMDAGVALAGESSELVDKLGIVAQCSFDVCQS